MCVCVCVCVCVCTGGLGAANVDVPSALPLRPVSGDAHVQGQGHDNAHAQGHVTMEEDLDFLGPELDAATAQVRLISVYVRQARLYICRH